MSTTCVKTVWENSMYDRAGSCVGFCSSALFISRLLRTLTA